MTTRKPQIMRKIIVLAVFCIASLPAYAKYGGGTGEPNDPYQIATAADLIALGESPGDYDKRFILTADIDLDPNLPERKIFDKAVIAPDMSDADRGAQANPFSGVFDGDGHAVSNLTIEGADYVGLFGVLDHAAEIRNLGLEGVNINGTGVCVGGLAGRCSDGDITDCYSTGIVHGEHYVGGLIGGNYSGRISNCHSVARVNGERFVGGLVGWNYGNISTSYGNGHVTGVNEVGGLVGYDKSTIISCHSAGAVNGEVYVGGLVGMKWGGLTTESFSSGTVNGRTNVGGLMGYNRGELINCHSSATATGNRAVGGLVGGAVWWVVIANCYSTGTASGDSQVGGLVGSGGVIWTSYSSADVWGGSSVGGLVGAGPASLTRCYSTGAVYGEDNVGGLVGANSGYVTRCHSVSVVEGAGSNVGGLVGKNEATLRSGPPIEGTVTYCFWDTQKSGQTTSAAGTGLTSVQMRDPQTYLAAGWDWVGEIDNGTCQIWQISDTGSHPVLTVFGDFALPQLEGSGTSEDPYLIHDAIELGATVHYDWYAHYRLEASIDLSRSSWGTAIIPHFAGVLDGGDCEISRLTINGGGNLGLFGRLFAGSEVRDLGVVDVNITGSSCGGLVGQNDGMILRCFSTGSINGSFGVGGLVGSVGDTALVTKCHSDSIVSGDFHVGGLVGSCGRGTVTNSHSHGAVSGNSDIGGLVGSNDGGTVTRCYSTASASGVESVGGLIGYNTWTIAAAFPGPARRSLVTNCYSTGYVSGDSCVGGLMGTNNAWTWSENCYSTGHVLGNENSGGLVGLGVPLLMSGCFWDIETSGLLTSAGGIGVTTAEMQTASTFIGWNGCDNEGVWTINEGNDYPRFFWEERAGMSLGGQLSDFLEGNGTEDDPYRIYTAAQLGMIGYFSCEWTKHFRLMADIDLAEYEAAEFNIIGKFETNAIKFRGVFDGDGHTISNFNCSYGGYGSVGLFAYVDDPNAKIKNVGLVDPNVDGARASGVGSLVGCLNQGTVTGCYVKGGSVRGDDRVGGLVGESIGTVINCYSTARVTGNRTVGGLLGHNGALSTNMGRFDITKVSRSGTVQNCYSVGLVFGELNAGGLIGDLLAGTVEHSFWNTQTSGQTMSAGGTGTTILDMQTAAMFLEAGWDFVDETENGTEDVWCILEGQDYPGLWWEVFGEN